MAVSSPEAITDDLPKIGPAPDFTLTTQDGKKLSLKSLAGKVVAVTFIYASCADTCPILTAKMVGLRSRLGSSFGSKVFFISITVDPDHDNVRVLKRYAEAHNANTAGWAFLTGSSTKIREVTRRYGIYYKRGPRGTVDHSFLTSLIDARGTLRVQYMGVRFNADELLEDIRKLLGDGRAK
jgi:protein SCO1/2